MTKFWYKDSWFEDRNTDDACQFDGKIGFDYDIAWSPEHSKSNVGLVTI